MEKNAIAIFTAGVFGRKLLKKIGNNHVCCFIDNDVKKQGTRIDDIPVVSLDEYKKKMTNVKVVIPAYQYLLPLAEQLKKAGITEWEFRNHDFDPVYPEDSLVINDYVNREDVNGTEVRHNSDMSKNTLLIDGQMAYVEHLIQSKDLFNHVEIETQNRCNGTCAFCPVNAKQDTRVKATMSEALFKSIIGQLADIEYDGRLSLFSNNEPFLDTRIVDFQRYARQNLPKAKLQLLTNGILLTLDMFCQIIDSLDYLIIDNYNDNLELNTSSEIIKEYCEAHPELIKKVTIVIRNPKEILTSRGGNAPNRKDMKSYPDASCCLPFKQLIIRPDGKVSLCCNDPLGLSTMGDLNEETILNVWNGELFRDVRTRLLNGRKNVKHCQFCDTFYYF